MIITNDLYYDTDKAVQFIKEKTGLDKETIVQVLNADVDFMKSIGIIEED